MKFSIFKLTFLFIFLNQFFVELFRYSNPNYKILAYIFLFSSGVLMIINLNKHYNKIRKIHLYFKVMLLLLFIWSLITIIRGISINSKELITLFVNYEVGAWSWFVPISLFFGLNIKRWRILFPFLKYFLLLGILLSVISVAVNKDLSALVLLSLFPFFILTFKYHRRKFSKFLIVLTIFFYFIYSFGFLSNRVALIITFLTLFFSYFETLRSKKINSHLKVVFVVIPIIFSLFLFLNFSKIIDYSVKKDNSLEVDTRTFLFVELFEDFNNNERWIGRGALGKYYSEYFFRWNNSGGEGGDSEYRSGSEIGYLHMIIKGGYIMVILYLMILIPAAYLGVFRSKNIISRMSGYYIFMYILMFSLILAPKYDLNFFMLWMSVGNVISSNLRDLKNNQVMLRKGGKLSLD